MFLCENGWNAWFYWGWWDFGLGAWFLSLCRDWLAYRLLEKQNTRSGFWYAPLKTYGFFSFYRREHMFGTFVCYDIWADWVRIVIYSVRYILCTIYRLMISKWYHFDITIKQYTTLTQKQLQKRLSISTLPSKTYIFLGYVTTL